LSDEKSRRNSQLLHHHPGSNSNQLTKMTFSKIKLFGFLALSCSLIACGQTPVATAPNATPTATSGGIAQTTTAPQPTETPVTVAKSPEPQPSVTQVPEKSPEPKPSATANGHSLLSASDQETLKSLGIKIAIPQYVPQGFRVETIVAKPCTKADKKFCRGEPSYTVVYGNAQNHCFAVDAISGGVGGPGSGRYNRAVDTKLLGKVDVAVDLGSRDPIQGPITEEIANIPQKNIQTLAGSEPPFYGVTTMIDNRVKSCATEAFMTPNEFIKVVQSLGFLP
jgi:hypothetical protein